MFPFIMTFLIGDLCVQISPTLLNNTLLGCLLLIAIFFCRRSKNYLLIAFFLGFSWTNWYASSEITQKLTSENEEKPILLTGYIASLPIKSPDHTSFMLSTKSYGLIQLNWKKPNHELQVGDKWQLQMMLKKIHSLKNPGSFDIEAWALQKNIGARGNVLVSENNLYLFHDLFYQPIDQIRQKLQILIQKNLPITPSAHWLMALMIGERSNIPQSEWQILQTTGTNHLMAIAGLHIGIIAGGVYFIVNRLWRLSTKLLLWLPVQNASVFASILVALIYSALAGFPLPTQRACIMLIIFSVLFISKKQMNPWYVWSLALGCVLILNPLSALSESFWLSFGTIACIIYGMSGRLAPTGWWWEWGRVQWVISVGLIPLSLLLFQETSLISFVANTIAIPWLAFFVLPFCFLSTILLFISPFLARWLLFIAGKSLAGLWLVLSWFSHYHFSSYSIAMPNYVVFALTLVACLFLLLPKRAPGRWFGILWFMPLLLYQPEKPSPGEVWLTLLDVGQGLSVVVQTASHLLVYDAGPKLKTGVDTGEAIVLPYLHTLGVKEINMLVISHADNDHIGGSAALLNTFSIKQIKTSVPAKLTGSTYCLSGEAWEWDGVRFSFIYPYQDTLNLGNDSSCVLRIEQGVQRILLTGDIEKIAEEHLLQRSKDQLAATILVAPHHGSQTSGLKEFIAAVHPQYVLYAVGYKNRYHFPHASVTTTYQAMKVKQLDTANSGMIQFKLGKKVSTPMQYRLLHPHYWYS